MGRNHCHENKYVVLEAKSRANRSFALSPHVHMGFKASCPQYISNMQGDWVLATPNHVNLEKEEEKTPFSLKETTRLPDKTTILTLYGKLLSTSCVQHITTDAWIHPAHWFISAQFLKYVPGAFLCSICDAVQKKTSPYMRLNYVNVNYSCLIHFAVNYCWSYKSVKRCKKKIDWEYDAKCHFNTTQQAKQSERSIREIIENRWSIWPTGRLKQASLKVKNFEQVRARHAQSKRWVKASKHPSL